MFFDRGGYKLRAVCHGARTVGGFSAEGGKSTYFNLALAKNQPNLAIFLVFSLYEGTLRSLIKGHARLFIFQKQ